PATRSHGAWLWRGRIEGLDAWAEAGADHDQPVSGLDAIDEHTLQVRLTAPYPQFVHTLANALSAVVPHEAVKHYGQEFGIRPVGSGPFRLQLLDETRAVLARNPAFDRGPFSLAAEGYEPTTQGHLGLESLEGRHYPFLDRLEIHFIGEPSARWISFASGRDVQNVMVAGEQAERLLLSRDPVRLRPDIEQRYHYLLEPEAGFVFFGFNMANPDLGHHDDPAIDADNRALRCAIRDAYDWEARNASFHYGMGQVFPGIIPPALSDFDTGLSAQSATHDTERARARLMEAGWIPERFPALTYGMESSVHQRQIFEQFRAKMTEAGLPPTMFQPRSFASFGDMSRAVANRQLDIFMMSWTLAYPDAQYNLQLFYGPNAAPGANSFNYANPDYDRLFEQASPLPPGELRSDLYRQMNEMVIDDCVAISGLSRTRLHLWQRQVNMLPDREMLGGHFLRFVDVTEKAATTE
ncbi:MAG: ABC transporter substrate-binding protein, partial [Wenzhouxiangella sp.]